LSTSHEYPVGKKIAKEVQKPICAWLFD